MTGWGSGHKDAHVEREIKVPRCLKAISAACLGVGALLLVPVVYYSYLNINPPVQRLGDIYFGDGTGFALAAVAALPAAVALATGLLVLVIWRRRS